MSRDTIIGYLSTTLESVFGTDSSATETIKFQKIYYDI
jgi:hypothetical protein